jgi:hypothetical protein
LTDDRCTTEVSSEFIGVPVIVAPLRELLPLHSQRRKKSDTSSLSPGFFVSYFEDLH